MTCLECQKKLSYLDHRTSMDLFQAELCAAHRGRLELLIRKGTIHPEAVMLYYGLRAAGARPMLAWWDGKKTVDLALSRVKLNIEIDRGLEAMTHEQAMHELEQTMHSFRNGFTTIRIPDFLIRNHLRETVGNVIGIMEGLKANLKVV